MEPACRPGTAAAAAAIIAVAIALAVRGLNRTAISTGALVPDAPLIGPRVRAWYRATLAPIEDRLVVWGVHPDALTWTQLGASVLAGAAFATGAVFLGGWLTILAGTLDILDGGVARRRGVASARGALVDSVIDRYAEFVTFFGLGLLFRGGWMLAVVAVACFTSFMVSYVRARAEGLGLTLAQGRAQRPERYVLLGFGAWLSGLVTHLACAPGAHAILAAALCLLAALSGWTALQRARHAAVALVARGTP